MLRLTEEGPPVPLCDEREEVALFATELLADDAAETNPLGVAFGWDTYEWTSGSEWRRP